MTQIVILAAGKGKRMNSEKPKVLHQVHGRPMISILVDSVMGSGVTNKPIIVVANDNKEPIEGALNDKCQYCIQDEQLGTGHAVRSAKHILANEGVDDVIVLYGDMPFISKETIQNLDSIHQGSNATLSMLTLEVNDFDDWKQGFNFFGRIIRDGFGKIERIVEYKDANEQEKTIKELNPSYFCFKTDWLWENIEKLKNKNAQQEYFLTDLVEMAVKQGENIVSLKINPHEAVGVNTNDELEVVQSI